MNKISVNINVFKFLNTAFPLSSIDEIRIVRKSSDQQGSKYAVYYNPNIFGKIDVRIFAQELINLILTNMPNTVVNITLNTSIGIELIDEECARNILQLDDLLSDYEHPLISYETSDSVDSLIDVYDEDSEEFDDDDLDDDDGDEDSEEFDPEEDEFDNSPFAKILKEERKMKKKSYGSSKVLKSAKKPKRQFKRHGLVIADSKSTLKKDEKIIKDFLKDFIPGKAGWIKEYREGILERWVKMYAITKKALKKLQKEHHNKYGRKNKNNNRITKENAMNFTRKFLSRDSWNDPTR